MGKTNFWFLSEPKVQVNGVDWVGTTDGKVKEETKSQLRYEDKTC